jgi:nitroreductase
METWDAIRARRDVREFENRPLAREELAHILEAARRTPSSSNRQRWDFVVVTDRDRLVQLAGVWRGAGHVAGAAAAVALVAPVSDDAAERESIQYDLGQATMSIMLAAADLGIGSRHAAVRDRDLAADLLSLPADRWTAWLISLGYPDGRPLTPIRTPDRRPFDDVVHWERW